MIDLTNIRSLTDFQRNAKKHLARMKRTGQPQVLTINGRAELIVQDAASYQKMLDELDKAEAIAGIQRGLEQVKQGKTYPIEQAFKRIARKHGIPNPYSSRRGR
jgi:PHD/YefM family antitoxin component YafN of YafNO toxin-antitoxin module